MDLRRTSTLLPHSARVPRFGSGIAIFPVTGLKDLSHLHFFPSLHDPQLLPSHRNSISRVSPIFLWTEDLFCSSPGRFWFSLFYLSWLYDPYLARYILLPRILSSSFSCLSVILLHKWMEKLSSKWPQKVMDCSSHNYFISIKYILLGDMLKTV